MTSLLKTNKEKTFLTFLLVSGFPQKHWQMYPRNWVISPFSGQCRTHESPAGNRVPLNPCVFQISHSAASCSPSSIPLLLHLLVYSFLLFSNRIDLMSTSCLNTNAVQVFAVNPCLWGCAKKGTDLLRVATLFSPSVLQYSPTMIFWQIPVLSMEDPSITRPCSSQLQGKQGVQLMFFSTSLNNSSPTKSNTAQFWSFTIRSECAITITAADSLEALQVNINSV